MRKVAFTILILQAIGVLALGWVGGKAALGHFFITAPPPEWGGLFAHNGVIALPGLTYWHSLLLAGLSVWVTLSMLVKDRRLAPTKQASGVALFGWVSSITLAGVFVARVSHWIMIPVFLISFLGVLAFWVYRGSGRGSSSLRKPPQEPPQGRLSTFGLTLSVFTLVEVLIMARFSELFALWSIGGS